MYSALLGFTDTEKAVLIIKHFVFNFYNAYFLIDAHLLGVFSLPPSGKVYYDMKQMRVETENNSKIALCRIEQVMSTCVYILPVVERVMPTCTYFL